MLMTTRKPATVGEILVELRTGKRGTTIRMHMSLVPAPEAALGVPAAGPAEDPAEVTAEDLVVTAEDLAAEPIADSSPDSRWR